MYRKAPLIRLAVVTLFFIANGFIWCAVRANGSSGVLRVVALNIGQGDAIFIETPNHNQILIDGGGTNKILEELGTVMPFYDRSIDMLVVTNPDKDHMGGFIDVLKNYHVGRVLEPGTKSDSATYAELEKTISEKQVPETLARRGMDFVLDDNVHLYTLFPDRDVSGLTTNDGSIVAKLVYGNTSFMLTGDSPQKIEEYLVSLDGTNLKSDVLKVGHHGSRTSTGALFLSYVQPVYAMISAGFKNKYGHPHKETIDNLNAAHVKTFITYEKGSVGFRSDGVKVIAEQ
ncbi:MBL fold metallo-hydrolase [Candidatus Parcubacteria bacterium]|nr:MBL fold metallo-hydrolase [Candidatus Parcubacteria bacterium]